jgi:N-methylhydantoinase A/oxoprolinase/acetone carboxylase beta subunit
MLLHIFSQRHRAPDWERILASCQTIASILPSGVFYCPISLGSEPDSLSPNFRYHRILAGLSSFKMYRVGVDVGGTNTDCAILDIGQLDSPSRGVLVSSKTPTTVDITSGITQAVQDVLHRSKVAKEDILSVTIGTTHFVNAVVEADERRLSKVAVVRLCGPSTRVIPPFTDYPLALRKIMEGPVYHLDGGLEIDGREIMPLDPKQIQETVKDIQKSGITKVALVGVFSPLDHAGIHEEKCRELMLNHDSTLDIVCSHSIGGVGLLERENATILNAAILLAAKRTVNGFKKAMQELELPCPLYLTQNDGTLTSAEEAVKFPIKTFASGPTNSMTGAAFLAGVDRQRSTEQIDAGQVLVVDIGGTTTDICALLPSGLPRQAPNFVEVGGVRTAFSMPDVLSVGLGGGSRIVVAENGNVRVGPESVGHYLTSKALVFGGDVLTSTDVAVVAGKEKIGNVKPIGISEQTVKGVRRSIKGILQRAIEEMRVSDSPVTVLLVGGGSILYMDQLDGVAKCIIPPHHDSANAVGAAIAKVAGEVDLIEILEGKDEAAVVKAAGEAAIQAAVVRGAEAGDVKIVEIEKLPLQYVSNKATRIRVKAIGKLRNPGPDEKREATVVLSFDHSKEAEEGEKKPTPSDTHKSLTKPSLDIDILSYRPEVRGEVWYLSEVDLEFIACGTGLLGTGGGGSSYLAYLMSLDALKKGGKGSMRVISPQSLKDDDLVAFGSWYGAPSVSGERLPSGTEITSAIDALNKVLGISDFQGLLTIEIGGGNG